MYPVILVPVDGSKLAERALSLAIPLAEQHHATLLLVHAHAPMMPLTFGGGAPVGDAALDEQLERDSRTYVERLARRTAKLTEVPVEAVFRTGKVVPTLCAVAVARGAGLIVMSTHGRGGFQRLWLGSVADALVRHATVPVLLVRGARPTAKRMAGAPPFVRFLVPVDGSARAEAAIDAAKTLAGSAPARLVLVHVIHPMSAVAGMNLKRDPVAELTAAYLEPLARRVATESLDIRMDARVDANVARVLLEAVEQHDADLIVMSGQGLSGVQRLLVGSVADKLIRTATVPVLVVPRAEGDATIQA